MARGVASGGSSGGSSAGVRRPDRERGAALVEAALVLPLLLLVVFGIVGFGATYSSWLGLRDGVRQAARSGAVNNFGSDATCTLTGATGASTAMKELLCLTKRETGLDPAQVRVKVLSADPTFTGAGTFAKNDALIVCAQVPTTGISSLVSPILSGKALRTKVAMRIESGDLPGAAVAEDPPPGQDWAWCDTSEASR